MGEKKLVNYIPTSEIQGKQKSFCSPEEETSQNSGNDHLGPLPTLVVLQISKSPGHDAILAQKQLAIISAENVNSSL